MIWGEICRGVFFALLFTRAGKTFLPTGGVAWGQLICTLLLLPTVAPVMAYTYDEHLAARQFPLLADFETPFERSRWKERQKLKVVSDIARNGKKSLKVQLTTATYSGVSLFYFPSNWRDYSTLSLSVYNPAAEPLSLTIRLHDRNHGEHNMEYRDRFSYRYEIMPGWNDLMVGLKEVWEAPESRFMDMAQIEGLGLFVTRQKKPRVFYIDYVRLTR